MKCIVIYGTLSGSTMTAAQLVSDTLSAGGHESNAVMAEKGLVEQVPQYEAVVFASPSWEDNGIDGQPLPEVREVIESLTADALSGKKIAICGLGDINYEHFCGAVDVMEGLLKDKGVTQLAVPSLKIDRYYSSPENEQKVKDWATSLAKALSS